MVNIVQFNEQLLFGGAITMPVPSTYMDASQIRQIPDNQEVYLDTESDNSLIVELLELDPVDILQSVENHFNQLAEDNDAINPIIVTKSKLTNHDDICLLIGQQSVSKFNENTVHEVNVLCGLVRLSTVASDILISMNVVGDINDGIISGFTVALEKFKVLDFGLFVN
ncbi:hypothetical protein BC833DRAFT_526417 [Globomyces pollinis-pini]|nr:hypothetical protein BC833DRAFT_526417 [Globomyces pollinis-pini]